MIYNYFFPLEILKVSLRVTVSYKCVNDVKYNTNCVTLSKLWGSNFGKTILIGDE